MNAPDKLLFRIGKQVIEPYKSYWFMQEGLKHPKILTMHLQRERSTIASLNGHEYLTMGVFYMVKDSVNAGTYRHESYELKGIALLGEVK